MTDAFQNNPPPLSPLDSVARFFRQFGGGPAPAPPLNLEQQAQRDQPDRTPPPDKGPFNWANNALPPGSPQPRQAPFQPFRAASIDRPPEQWGQEEQFPNLPQSFEIPSLATGLSQWFGQNGSIPSSMIAQAMARHPAEFMQGVLKGQQERAREAREALAFHITELKERQEEEMTRYAEVMSAHGALNETGDPAKMLKPVGGKTLMEDLYDTAREIGDIGRPGTLGDLIASGAKPSEIIKFLQARDGRLRDLQKLKATADEDTAEETRWGLKPAQQAGPTETEKYAGGVQFGQPATPQIPPSPAAPQIDPKTGGPAPKPAPEPKLGDGDTAAMLPGPDGNMVPAGTEGVGGDEPGITPIDSLKHTMMDGGKEPPAAWIKTHPKEFDAALLKTNQADATLDRIIRRPPKDRSQILPMVRALNPDMASIVDQVAHYRDPASGGQSGTGASIGSPASQLSNRVRNLVMLIRPDWNQGNYQQRQLFQHDFRVQTMLARAQDLAPMAMQLADDLRVLEKDLKARGLNANNVNLMGLLERFGDDPKYVRMRSDLLAYNNAYNTLVTAGHNTITGVRLQEQGLDPWAPIATYRGVMQGHAVGASGMVSAMRHRWASAGGGDDPMPGGDEDAFKTIRNISKWDYVSGAMPYDPANPDNDIVNKKAGPWGPAGHYYWLGAFPADRDDPRNWKRVE